MRDTLKDENYFKAFIQTSYQIIAESTDRLKAGLIAADRIQSSTKAKTYSYLQIIGAKYSMGVTNIEEMQKDLCNGIQLLNECMVDNNGKFYVSKTKVYLDQYYTHIYEEILHYLALAYLLDISKADFKVLINIIDRDKINNDLYEFIIKASFPNREQERTEEFDPEKSVVLIQYDKLDKATKETDKKESSKLVKQFLKKGFYHKHMNAYNSHNNKGAIYSGYWSYEAVTVVKILGLDDSSFATNKYYPKDLIHFNNK
jgi:hypothetical protein